MLTGFRQAGFQVIRCPQCGSERFILPRSPFAEIAETAPTGVAAAPRTWTATLWLLPLASVILTVAIMALVYWMFLVPPTKRVTGVDSPIKKSSAERLQLARRYFTDGLFRLAADELLGDPDDLSPDEKRRWRQLKRETALLADLCAEPLEDILHHAARVPEREWLADFPRRYRGQAILFDTIVQRKANGKLYSIYVFPGPDRIRLELGDLELFRHVALEQPRRVVFGARLASIRLEPPGPAWEVRFEADSGVFLTDARAAGLCCPALNEPDAVRVLDEQAKLAVQ